MVDSGLHAARGESKEAGPGVARRTHRRLIWVMMEQMRILARICEHRLLPTHDEFGHGTPVLVVDTTSRGRWVASGAPVCLDLGDTSCPGDSLKLGNGDSRQN